LKRRNVFVALAGACLMVSLAGSESLAQSRSGVWRLPTRSPGRQAAQPRPEPRPPQRHDPPVVVVPSQGGSLLNPVYRVPIIVVPAVLLLDGSIFANFGFGYEPILRICGATATQGAVIASNGVVLHPAPASHYTVPVASQLTRSDLLRTGLPVHDAMISDYARLACFSSGASMVYVYR
jgi:hypothetical protein